MKIQIVGINNRGVANQEMLHLKALTEVNLGYYAVFNTFYINPKAISNSPNTVFWFPTIIVKPGDQILLYTGIGLYRAEETSFGNKNHFFYWNQSTTLWNNPQSCAVLFELSTWETTPQSF